MLQTILLDDALLAACSHEIDTHTHTHSLTHTHTVLTCTAFLTVVCTPPPSHPAPCEWPPPGLTQPLPLMGGPHLLLKPQLGTLAISSVQESRGCVVNKKADSSIVSPGVFIHMGEPAWELGYRHVLCNSCIMGL